MRYFPTLLALALTLPVVLAQDNLTQTTTPVSRHYLDPLTNLVYYYDAQTQTLTPAPEGTIGGATVYAFVDVYARDEWSSVFAGVDHQCGADFCVSWILAYVGTHRTSLAIQNRPANLGCAPFDVVETASPRLGLVTYWQGTWEVHHCAPGLACAELRTNDLPRSRDCITY